jgi:hypothetical protein
LRGDEGIIYWWPQKGKGIKKLLEKEKNIVILNMMFYGNMGRY